jgi:hypothetical protein
MPAARESAWEHRLLRFVVGASLLWPAVAWAGEQASSQQVENTASPAQVAVPSAEATTSPPRFAAGTHFSLSWARLPGGEACISGKELSRAVEDRLHHPAFGAPSETDVAIEGYIGPDAAAGYHAVVTLTDARGTVVGKRELASGTTACRDIDATLALAIALMIDPDAAFAATAQPAPRPPAPKPPPPVAPVQKRPRPPALRGGVGAGVVVGFGLLPHTAGGAWVGGFVEPRGLFPLEIGAHLWLDQVTSVGQDVEVAFSRMTLGVSACPLGAHIGAFRFAACAGMEAGTIAAVGPGKDGQLLRQRSAIADVALAGHVDARILEHVTVRVTPALAIPLVRDSFNYHRDDGTLEVQVYQVYQLPPVGGEVGAGLVVELP